MLSAGGLCDGAHERRIGGSRVRLRRRGPADAQATGLTRVGALIGPASGGGLIALGVPIFGQMLIFGVPLVLGSAALLALGVETRRRRLEEIEVELAPLAAS